MDPTFEVINQQAFYDGQSFDSKIGPEASFAYSRGFDWRKNPSELVQTLQPRRIDPGNLGELLTNIIQVATGERFALGSKGGLYVIDTSNGIVKVTDIPEPAAFGLLYRVDTDTLYIAGAKALHTYGPVKDSVNRKLTPNFLAANESTNTSGSAPSIRTGGAKTYAVPTTLTEADVHRLTFTSDIEPLRSVKLQVTDKGTGNWTVAVHDPLHREVASKTIAAADMVPGLVEFSFSTAASLLVKPNARQYHAHVTSSATGGKVACSTENDLNTADFRITADRFVTSNGGMHCMEHFLQYIAIQHGRYLALWEPLTDAPDNAEYERHKITAPDDFDGCGLAKTDEFLIIGYRKVATSASRSYNESLLLFWDGLAKLGNSGSYNFYIEIKGTLQAMYTDNNVPHFIIDNTLFVWLGGKSLTRVRDLPNSDNDFTGVKDDTRMNPYTMTSYRHLLQIAYPSTTSNAALEFGVYNYGRRAPEYTPSFGYQYQLSHGARNTSGGEPLEIGCAAAFGDEMYISWRKGDKYGLDILDSNCKVASSFKVRMRQFDARNVHKRKGVNRVIISTSPVPAGTSVYPTYTLDDDTEVIDETPMPEGATQAVLTVDSEFHVIDYGLQGESADTVSTPLRIRGVALEWDPNLDEDLTDNE